MSEVHTPSPSRSKTRSRPSRSTGPAQAQRHEPEPASRKWPRVLEKLRYETSSRVVVVTGAGESFCAGMDSSSSFVELKYIRRSSTAFSASPPWRSRTLRYYPKPTIAMVNGYWLGGAFSIVEGCDLAFAAKRRRSGCRKSTSSITPAASVSKSLANCCGADALYYAMTGRTFKGDRAAEIGFVNAPIRWPISKRVMALATDDSAQKDPDALAACKDGYRFSLEMTQEAALNFAAAKSDQLSLRQKVAGAAKASAISSPENIVSLGGHERRVGDSVE